MFALGISFLLLMVEASGLAVACFFYYHPNGSTALGILSYVFVRECFRGELKFGLPQKFAAAYPSDGKASVPLTAPAVYPISDPKTSTNQAIMDGTLHAAELVG